MKNDVVTIYREKNSSNDELCAPSILNLFILLRQSIKVPGKALQFIAFPQLVQ